LVIAKLIKFEVFGPYWPQYLPNTARGMVQPTVGTLFHSKFGSDRGSGWVHEPPDINIGKCSGFLQLLAIEFRAAW